MPTTDSIYLLVDVLIVAAILCILWLAAIGILQLIARIKLALSQPKTYHFQPHIPCPFDDDKLCEKWLELTDREQEAVYWAGQGETNKKIASRLHIEEPTVKTHLKNGREKLGLATKRDIERHIWRSR